MSYLEFVSHGSTTATSSEAKIVAMKIPSLSSFRTILQPRNKNNDDGIDVYDLLLIKITIK